MTARDALARVKAYCDAIPTLYDEGNPMPEGLSIDAATDWSASPSQGYELTYADLLEVVELAARAGRKSCGCAWCCAHIPPDRRGDAHKRTCQPRPSDPLDRPPVDHGSDRYDYVEITGVPEGVVPRGGWLDALMIEACPDCRANVFLRYLGEGRHLNDGSSWDVTIAHDDTCPTGAKLAGGDS